MAEWEWLKIVASAVVGMFAGIIAEPLKQQMMIQVKRKRIGKALVAELLRFRGTMCWVADKLDEQIGKDSEATIRKSMLEVFLNEPREAFDHYYDKEKEALFTVENWGSFVNTYRYLKESRDRVIKDENALGDAVSSSINITDGELTRRGFESVFVCVKQNDHSMKKRKSLNDGTLHCAS